MKNAAICRDFLSSTWLSTGVEDGAVVVRADNVDLSGAAVSDHARGTATVENVQLERSVYTRRSRTLIDAHTT
jgi:hypothetical protein